jgi:hypothetical protein
LSTLGVPLEYPGVPWSTLGVPWEYPGSTFGVPWEYPGSTLGVPGEYPGSTLGVPWVVPGEYPSTARVCASALRRRHHVNALGALTGYHCEYPVSTPGRTAGSRLGVPRAYTVSTLELTRRVQSRGPLAVPLVPLGVPLGEYSSGSTPREVLLGEYSSVAVPLRSTPWGAPVPSTPRGVPRPLGSTRPRTATWRPTAAAAAAASESRSATAAHASHASSNRRSASSCTPTPNEHPSSTPRELRLRSPRVPLECSS